MNLKIYCLTVGLCLSQGACTMPQMTDAINSATASNQDPLETFLLGCNNELYTYCKDVTPGDGRELACIFAHEDRLSGRCENALYGSAQQLDAAVAALAYFAAECDADIEQHCSNIVSGEGRIMDCMETHLKAVSKRCQKAMQEVGPGK